MAEQQTRCAVWLLAVALALALLEGQPAAGCDESETLLDDGPVEVVPPHFSVSELRLHEQPEAAAGADEDAAEPQSTTKKAKTRRRTTPPSPATPSPQLGPRSSAPAMVDYRPAAPRDQCEFEISCNSAAVKLPKFRTTLLHTDDRPEPPAALRLPVQASVGPPGPPGAKGDRGDRGSPGLAGDAVGLGVDEMVQKTAFFVGLMENFGPHSRPEDVRFDHIVTNVGNAYNETTGRFTAPRNGTYQFHVTIAAQGDQRAAVRLLIKAPNSRDNRIVFTLWCESIPFWSSTSNNAVLWMNADEQVWVRALSTASAIHGYMYSTFSGHGLFPDAEYGYESEPTPTPTPSLTD